MNHARHRFISTALAIATAVCTAGFAPHAAAQVYRCGSSYQSEPCKGGRTVNTAPTVVDHDGPSWTRIFLCKKASGEFLWTNLRCADRGWALERTETVNARASWEDQVQEAQMKWGKGLQLVQDANTPRGAAAAPPSNPAAHNARRECATLDQQIQMYDSMGRAGSLHYDLDWVRRERKRARDRQYQLGC